MAVFSREGSRTPKLLDSGFAGFDDEVSVKLAHEAVVAITLKRLMDNRKPDTHRVRISVEGSAVFSRLVKLPMVGKEQLEKTIRHEAVQNIPFPIDEVVWDAYVIDPEAPEPEVLLVAVKSGLIEGLVHAVQANGLTIEIISVAPVALANAVRSTEKINGSILLIDVGAASCNLVFMDGPRTFFRTLPIAGNDIDRLVQETERSITFYRSRQQGRPPERILIDRSMAEMLDRRLSSPVEPLELSIASVCMGLAADQAVAINLVPVSLRQEQALKQRLPLWVAAAVMLMLLLSVWIHNFNLQLKQTHRVKSSVEQEVRELSQIEQQLLPIEERIAGLQRRAAVFDAALVQRTFWLETLEEVRRLLPEGMFLLASEPLRPEQPQAGMRISVVSYLDKEPAGQDAVKLLRDTLRSSLRFGNETAVYSRPSKKLFAREFVLDVYFTETRSDFISE